MRAASARRTLAEIRAALTDEPSTFRFRPHVHQRQALPASQPLIQVITPAIRRDRAFLFFHEMFFLRATKRQRFRRHRMIIAFHHDTINIRRRPNQLSKQRRRRHHSHIRPAERANQNIPKLVFESSPHRISQPNHRKTIRTMHNRLQTLNPKSRRRPRTKRPTPTTTRERIKVLARRRKRPKLRFRPEKKFPAIRRRRPRFEIFAKYFVLQNTKHIFRVTLIRRRQQLVPTAIRQPHRRSRQSRKHLIRFRTTHTNRNTSRVPRDHPNPIRRTRRQATHPLNHTHTTITRTNIHRRSFPTNTRPTNIFKPVRRIHTNRVDLSTKIRKRRRNTTNRHRNHQRSTRSHKRFSFTFLQTPMFHNTSSSHKPITINPATHKTTNTHFSTNFIIPFPQPFPYRTPPTRKHTRNFIPRPPRHKTRKTTLTFPDTLLKLFFTNKLKITLRQSKIFTLNVIKSPPHHTTQLHSPPTRTHTTHPTRHRTRKIRPRPKHINHIPFTNHHMPFIFRHFIPSHIKIPPNPHSNTTPRIFPPELILLRTTSELPKQLTLRVKLPNNPPRTLSFSLDQNIPITRIHRNTKQTTHEQFFYFPFYYPRSRDSPFETPRRRKHINLKTMITLIINHINITRKCTAARVDSHAFNRCPHTGTPRFGRLTFPLRFTDQFIPVPNIFCRTRSRTGKISRLTFWPRSRHRPLYFGIPGACVI